MASTSPTSGRQPSFGGSNYFPTGWDRERLLRLSTADLHSLPAGEFDKLRAGMIEKMGANAYQRWVGLLSTSAPAANKGQAIPSSLSSPAAPVPVPEYLHTTPWGSKDCPWGFVVFRSTGYDMSQEAWEGARKRIEAATLSPLEPCLHDPVVKYAAERFELQWVQDEALEGADVELVAR